MKYKLINIFINIYIPGYFSVHNKMVSNQHKNRVMTHVILNATKEGR